MKKVKVTLDLDPEMAERLAVHAIKMKVNRCDLVDELIRTHLRRFVVSDRERNDAPPVGEDRQSEAA